MGAKGGGGGGGVGGIVARPGEWENGFNLEMSTPHYTNMEYSYSKTVLAELGAEENNGYIN